MIGTVRMDRPLRPRPERGYRSTRRHLIEVVAVMMIIALVASLAVTMPGTGRGGLKALTLETAALLRRERLGAVLTGRDRQVSLDSERRVLVGDGGNVSPSRGTSSSTSSHRRIVVRAPGRRSLPRMELDWSRGNYHVRMPNMKFASIGTREASQLRSDGSRQAGFTLLEALVALAVIPLQWCRSTCLGAPHHGRCRQPCRRASSAALPESMLPLIVPAWPTCRGTAKQPDCDGDVASSRSRLPPRALPTDRTGRPIVMASVAWGADQVITAETYGSAGVRAMKMQRNRTRAGCDKLHPYRSSRRACDRLRDHREHCTDPQCRAFFDRGTERSGGAPDARGERLAGDFSSARFVPRRTEQRAALPLLASRPASSLLVPVCIGPLGATSSA
jgi:prepilin-type N-terminal cleavage/methylation domain-containing protein